MTIPQPEVTPLNEPHWQGLREGRLMIQRCTKCGHHWLPAREDCPSCLHDGYRWVQASGRGRLISWVVYHTAFNKAFADRLPYSVAVVELEEGARTITNIGQLAGRAQSRPARGARRRGRGRRRAGALPRGLGRSPPRRTHGCRG